MNQYQLKNRVKRVTDKILSSIIDPELKDLVQNKTFLTGGCFKSIWHGEKVNDYDFYFIDRESADKFKELVNKGLQDTSKPFTNQKDLTLHNYNSLYNPRMSQFAITFTLEEEFQVQFITKYVGGPDEVVANFDFMHAQNYYVLADGTFHVDTSHLADKELKFNIKASHPINALKRLAKFISQGWTIDDKQLIQMAEAINGLNLDTYENWKEQTAAMYGSHEVDGIIIFNNNIANEKTKEVLIKWVD